MSRITSNGFVMESNYKQGHKQFLYIMAEDNQAVTNTQVKAPEGEGTGEGDTNVDAATLTLDQLNEFLGTNYSSKEKALEGLKETKNYVGKAGVVEKENAELKQKIKDGSGDFITKEQYENDIFYSKHSDLEPYKEIINSRAKELGVRPAEAVEKDDSLKQTLEKLRGYDKTEGAKSVLMSNQRLGQVTNKMEKAIEAQKAGDYNTAVNNAVDAVIDTFQKK